MRKVFSVALMAALFGLVQSANAGVTIDVHFADETSPTGLTITPGDAGGGPGCTFTGYYARTVASGRCMDVILKTTFPLIVASASVAYESDNGLAVAMFHGWVGMGVSWNAKGALQKECATMAIPVDDGSKIGEFDCVIPFPPEVSPVSPGTYRVGTIVWDTSGTTPGSEGISVSLLLGGVGAIINGNIFDYTDSVVAGSHILNITGEPTPLPSMSAKGVTMLGVAVFGIGILGLVIAARRRQG